MRRPSLAAATLSPEQVQHPRLQSEHAIFASCLDNARRCFLVLKFVFLPLSCVFGGLAVLLHILCYLGYIQQYSILFFLHICATALITAAPVVLIPAIVRLRFIPVSVRLTLANTLFVAVCLITPFLNAHLIWHRRYRELNGFLWVYEFLVTAPSSASAASHQSFDSLSICDDNYFFVLFVLDHALVSVSRFVLPTMIELPPAYFSFTEIVRSVVLWSSAFRIGNIYINTCGNHPSSAANAEIAKLYLPLGHMIHLACFLVHLFTALFVSSRNREHNKKLVRSLLTEAFSTSKIHLNALFFSNRDPKPRQSGTFWSRTEFLTSKQEQPPLVLPAGVGIVYKVSLGLKDFSLYVWALSLPIYFTVFELMRAFITVDPHVRRIVHASSWKCAVLLLCLSAPHFLLVKAIRGGRVRQPFLVTMCYIATIILCGVFILPGMTGSVWNRNFRFFPYFIVSNVAPPTILRAVSHSASSQSLVAVFVLLHMY
jgi:hypothetical protein